MFQHFLVLSRYELNDFTTYFFFSKKITPTIQAEKHKTDKLTHVGLDCCRQKGPFTRPKQHSIISILLSKLLQRHEPELIGPTRFLVVCLAFVFCREPCVRCEIGR